ncbi:hypothetical protein AB1Y20_011052 [Prymnesium parvum]|uniref:Uncharacterized protein n=1 Tax=Prymnesium parvum TaxID=97485 RepID=A0AB34ING8_PRYPA|mmetsp:Transcript_7426/g.11277  ORF Transcript_7426/g.11277 Transcript_7426/m.11277 type:complete len:100 (+) Transcript_7426:204-503(+)
MRAPSLLSLLVGLLALTTQTAAYNPSTPHRTASRTAAVSAHASRHLPREAPQAKQKPVWFELDHRPEHEPDLSCYMRSDGGGWVCANDADFKFDPEDGY